MSTKLVLPEKRSINRRDFLKLAAVGVGAGFLAACSKGETGGSSFTTTGQEKGTLVVWGWTGTFEGVQSQIAEFNKKFPNIVVDVKDMGYEDVHTNLLNAIVAGTGAPDLCAIDVLRLTNYTDGLVDLSAQALQYMDQFVVPTYSVGSYQGKFYGLATDSEPMAMFYRVDIWDQYGIKEADIETWDDLINAGEKLYKDSGEAIKMYTIESGGSSLLEVMAVEQGFKGFFFNDTDTKVIVDDPKMVDAVTIHKRMWDSKCGYQNPQDGYSGDEATALFKDSKLAAQIIGPAWYPQVFVNSMPELSGKWRMMRAPAITQGGKRIGYQYPTIFVMPTQSTLKGPAWELCRLGLLGAGAKVLYEQMAVLPAYKPLFDEIRDQPIEYFGGQKINALFDEIAKDTPAVFFGSGFPEAQSIFTQHLQIAMDGTQSPQEAMSACAKEMREKLKKG